ncbi:MAG: cation-translocating P-type ATPase C-terminal domain-containing protein, partial [Eubacteriales bacterium]|nr:cation-translocating P-type ATPase C-terminal domain-containing protein [Eubacteriales bacterium]
AFTILAISQLFHAIGMRDVDRSIFRKDAFANKMMIFAVTFGLVLQVAVTEIPFLSNVFGTTQLHFTEWLCLAAFSMIPLVFHEIIVLVRRKVKRGGSRA